MKTIKLKHLTLKNFKGIKALDINFTNNTEISGANATGKSSIFDAFTWLLFGKNSQDKTDFGIKTVDFNGIIIPKIDHEVKGVIEVNGLDIELTRILVENWVKPRGQAEAEFRGNNTRYLIDGIEVQAGKYQDAISDIIPEELFKLITNTNAFTSLHWEKQREILFSIAGNLTLEDVAAGNSNFQEIVKEIAGKDLSEFKKKIAYQKKVVKDELDKIPSTIKGIEIATPEAPNYNKLEAEKTELIAQLERVDEAIASEAKAQEQHLTSVRNRTLKLHSLKMEKNNIEYILTTSENERVKKANAEYNDLKEKSNSLKEILERLNTQISESESIYSQRINSQREFLRENEIKIKKLREDYTNVFSEEFPIGDELICPAYGIPCTDPHALKMREYKQEESQVAFLNRKEERLELINKDGEFCKIKISEIINKIAECEKEHSAKLDSLLTEKRDKESILNAVDAKLTNSKAVVAITIDFSEDEKWNIISKEIEVIEAEESSEEKLPNNAELKMRRTELGDKLVLIREQLSIKNIIEKNKTEKEKLLQREKELAQQLAEVEKREFTAENLLKTYTTEVENRVNQLFSIVKFKMFKEQINSGEAPFCTAMVDGVVFSDLNTAMKINAGLDIIHTLSTYNRINAPVFVDNAESVNTVMPIPTQVVKLIVTTDQELQISNK